MRDRDQDEVRGEGAVLFILRFKRKTTSELQFLTVPKCSAIHIYNTNRIIITFLYYIYKKKEKRSI